MVIRERRITYCTPKSPVEKTSSLFKVNTANISTDHLPNPLTAINLSSRSESLARSNISLLRSPEANFWANPWIYSALRWERPAERSVGRSQPFTSVGVGKPSLFVSLNKPTNRSLIDFAAAPETCWPMILLTRLRNGSTCSASPAGEKSGQYGFRSMMGLSRASAAIRWATAFSRRVSLVVVASSSRFKSSGG